LESSPEENCDQKQEQITFILHLDSFYQQLPELEDFNPDRATSSLWTVFNNLRTILQASLSRFKSQQIIVIHRGDGNFGRRVSKKTDAQSTFKFSYISALSGMLKSISSEYQSCLATIVDVDSKLFETDKTSIFLRHILSLKEPAQEYSIDQLGLQVHTLIPFAPTQSSNDQLVCSFRPNCLLSIGGARGIAVSALEKLGSKQTCLIIAGRSDLFLPEWYDSSLSTSELRSRLIQIYRAAQKTFTPALIEKELRKVLSSAEAISSIDRLSKIYSSVKYVQVDLFNPNSQDIILNFLNQHELQVDSILNVAGVIDDSLVSNKTQDSFERVMLIKLNSLKLTFKLIESYRVSTVVNFASIAGKTGNLGQSDYASANELINAGSWLASSVHPEVKIYSINWGPWASVGMATKEVNEAFAARGIIPIPLDEGAKTIASLFTHDLSLPIEVTTGIYDTSMFSQSDFNIREFSHNYPYLGSHSLCITSSVEGAIQFDEYKFWVDPLELPYLSSHKKFNRPVLPAAASCAFTAEAFHKFKNKESAASSGSVLRIMTEVLSGIVFDDNNPKELVFSASTTDDKNSISCTLKSPYSKRISYRTTAANIPTPEMKESLSLSIASTQTRKSNCKEIAQEHCYKNYLFHDGVFEVISGLSTLFPESNTIISSLESKGADKILGRSELIEGYLDPSLLDGLLQMGLILLRELYQTSALPNRLVVDIYAKPLPGQKYLATGHIIEVNEKSNRLFYEGIILSEDGSPLLCLSEAEMTHSKSMLD